MEGNREIGVGSMKRSGGAIYVLLMHLSLPLSFVLVKVNFKSVSEVSKFRVNSLSIVYHYLFITWQC